MNTQFTSHARMFPMALIAALFAWGAYAADPMELVKKSPAENAAAQRELSKELIALGAPGIKQLCGMLTDKADDANVRYALHGLATYAARPGADADRKLFTGALIEALEGNAQAIVKEFLLQQIRLTGGPENIAALAKFLSDENLCEPTAQFLVTVRGEQAAAALRAALPSAQGKRRITILKALGDLQDAQAAPLALKDAASDDQVLRLTALYALGASGNPAAIEPLAKASASPSRYEQSDATRYYLLLARRLSELNKKDPAAKICRELYKNRADEPNVQTAALTQLALTLGAEALPDLTAALQNPSNQVKEAVMGIAAGVPGEAVTRWFMDRMKSAPAERAAILAKLLKRGDKVALPAVIEAIKDGAPAVRRAAITAAGEIGGKDALPALLEVLGAKDEGERRAARDAMMTIRDDIAPWIAENLKSAAPAAKAGLIRVLAGRGAANQREAVLAATNDADDDVRAASLEALGVLGDATLLPMLIERLSIAKTGAERDASEKAVASLAAKTGDLDKAAALILEALKKAAGPAKASLIKVIGSVPSPAALPAVNEAIKDSDKGVQDAAFKVLTEWPDLKVAPDLLALARTAQPEKRQILAARGYIRLADKARATQSEVAARMFQDAVEIARRPDEKKQLLGALSELKNLQMLKIAQGMLTEEAVRNEACVAVLKIAGETKKKNKAETAAALKALLEVSQDKKDRKSAQDILNEIAKMK
ncbi:MAG: HEAT repeat domain-containing protein [Candidatus Sumerlaeota bacterium]|nr:HEAT repeat domain-containing protein [Candidatus Sumerlaeota bacterium]